MRFLAAGFCVPVVPESGILVGMYEIHEEVLCPEGIYPHGDTGYSVCNSCKEYAGGHPARLGLQHKSRTDMPLLSAERCPESATIKNSV